MTTIGERANAMCAAPLGCAFLIEARECALAPDVIAFPRTTFQLLSRAINTTTVWAHDYENVVKNLLEQGKALHSLAEAVLREPGSSWWFGPLDRSAQITAERWGEGWRASNPVPPKRVPSQWERYARKPGWSQPTSTLRNGATSFLYNMAVGTGDLFGLSPPVYCDRLQIRPDARIYEVDGTDAWHRLCTTYPARFEPPVESENVVVSHGLIVPDYAAAARDWDAVHITIGALLTAAQVRVDGDDGWSMLWGFDAEMSIWMRPVWDKVKMVAFDEPAIQSWRVQAS